MFIETASQTIPAPLGSPLRFQRELSVFKSEESELEPEHFGLKSEVLMLEHLLWILAPRFWIFKSFRIELELGEGGLKPEASGLE